MISNVGEEVQEVEVSRLFAGNIDLEEVLDQRATRAGFLPKRYRIQAKNMVVPAEQLV